MSVVDAILRLSIFLSTPGDFIGPLRASYGAAIAARTAYPEADTYEEAMEQFKADIRMLLEEIEHAHRNDPS